MEVINARCILCQTTITPDLACLHIFILNIYMQQQSKRITDKITFKRNVPNRKYIASKK